MWKREKEGISYYDRLRGKSPTSSSGKLSILPVLPVLHGGVIHLFLPCLCLMIGFSKCVIEGMKLIMWKQEIACDNIHCRFNRYS